MLQAQGNKENKEGRMAHKSLSILEAYKRVFNSDDGKLILEDLSQKCFIWDATVVPNDENTSSFNEGKRCVVIDIMKAVSFDTTNLIKIIERIQKND